MSATASTSAAASASAASTVAVKGLGELPARISFPAEEEKTLAHWEETDAFQESLRRHADLPPFRFFDGPPFATGQPHYGHILAGTIKDVVCRYAHMTGHSVERRFGWDTHGLPIEFEINKLHGIKTRDEVDGPDGIGIPAYNKLCRSIVMKYSEEWRKVIGRMGRWIDFDNDYKTMDVKYMESVWWVFKQLWEKDLVYRGFKVMPYSSACSTPLSLFEAKSNYMNRVDPAVVVAFPTLDDENVCLLAWTTTPWTLPSHLTLAVHPELVYTKIRDLETKRVYLLGASRLQLLYKTPEEGVTHEVLEPALTGAQLEGIRYHPPFDFFLHMRESVGAFRVILASYVTADAGTCIVHQAPAFGEDDYDACLAAGIVIPGGELPCPLDNDCCFTAQVDPWKGLLVFDANPGIVKALKQSGRLVRRENLSHPYPYCWRSDTPLVYRAVSSWFVRMSDEEKTRLEEEILPQINWCPEHVSKRFLELVRGAPDWNVSRNRFWGTPLPIWVSDDLEEMVCVGSVDQLEKLTGVRVSDLHRETVDSLEIPSARDPTKKLHRVSEVLDCWFESGAMPYGQLHYPFENKEVFEAGFPADFIAEGIDQTRGWFNKLVVLSTALFGKPAFKNVIVNGMVLASDGKKMSKRLRNYPPPMDVVDRYGADAVRLYLITSPVVQAQDLRFKEEGVRAVVTKVFVPWFNAYRFLVQATADLRDEHQIVFSPDIALCLKGDNFMDRWLMAATQSLIQFVHTEMKAYRLYTVIPRLIAFIDQLTKWYIRFNRERLRGRDGIEQQQFALNTLYEVLFQLNVAMAPLTPFFTEYVYQHMKHALPADKQEDSVHFLPFPTVRTEFFDEEIEAMVAAMQDVITLGRTVRDRNTKPVKCPLKSVEVICNDQTTLDRVLQVKDSILQELNIRNLTTSTDLSKLSRSMVPTNEKSLGPKLRGDRHKVYEAMKTLSSEKMDEFEANGKVEILGHEILNTEAELQFFYVADEADADSQFAADSNGSITVVLNLAEDNSLLQDYTIRELVNRVQRLRKEAGVVPTDPVEVFYKLDVKKSPFVAQMLQKRLNDVVSAIKKPVFQWSEFPYGALPQAASVSAVPAQDRTEFVELAVLLASLTAGGKSLSANDRKAVQLYLNVCSAARLQAALADGKTLPVEINGKMFQLQLGVNVFNSVQERLEAEQ